VVVLTGISLPINSKYNFIVSKVGIYKGKG